jgi:hypothetical protein
MALWCLSGYYYEPLIKLWSVPQSQWISWEPPIKLWRLPKLCMGPVTTLKGSIVVGSSILVGGIEEITLSLCGIWGALCLHTPPTDISTRKVVIFRIHCCLCVPRLFLYPRSFMQFTL